MFFNQQVTQQRVLKLDAPRLVALMALISAALLFVGCKSAGSSKRPAGNAVRSQKKRKNG